MSTRYIIRRNATPGMLDTRPRYLTRSNGWTYRIQHARRFDTTEAATPYLSHPEDEIIPMPTPDPPDN